MDTPSHPGAAAPDTLKPLDSRFAGYGFQNWSMNDEPPILVNPKARLHSKLAWCWGEANQIEELAFTLSTHADHQIRSIGNLLLSRVMPLQAMLDHLAENTTDTDCSQKVGS